MIPCSLRMHHKQSKRFICLICQANYSKIFICRNVTVQLFHIIQGKKVISFMKQKQTSFFFQRNFSKIAQIQPIDHFKDSTLLICQLPKYVSLKLGMQIKKDMLPIIKEQSSTRLMQQSRQRSQSLNTRLDYDELFDLLKLLTQLISICHYEETVQYKLISLLPHIHHLQAMKTEFYSNLRHFLQLLIKLSYKFFLVRVLPYTQSKAYIIWQF